MRVCRHANSLSSFVSLRAAAGPCNGPAPDPVDRTFSSTSLGDTNQAAERILARLGEPDWRGPEARKKQVTDLLESLDQLPQSPFISEATEKGLHRLLDVLDERETFEIAYDLFEALAKPRGDFMKLHTTYGGEACELRVPLGLGPTGLLSGVDSFLEFVQLEQGSPFQRKREWLNSRNSLTALRILRKGEVLPDSYRWFWRVTCDPVASLKQAALFETLPPNHQDWAQEQIRARLHIREDANPSPEATEFRKRLPDFLEALAMLPKEARPQEHLDEVDSVARLWTAARSRAKSNRMQFWTREGLKRLLDHCRPKDRLATARICLELENHLTESGFNNAFYIIDAICYREDETDVSRRLDQVRQAAGILTEVPQPARQSAFMNAISHRLPHQNLAEAAKVSVQDHKRVFDLAKARGFEEEVAETWFDAGGRGKSDAFDVLEQVLELGSRRRVDAAHLSELGDSIHYQRKEGESPEQLFRRMEETRLLTGGYWSLATAAEQLSRKVKDVQPHRAAEVMKSADQDLHGIASLLFLQGVPFNHSSVLETAVKHDCRYHLEMLRDLPGVSLEGLQHLEAFQREGETLLQTSSRCTREILDRIWKSGGADSPALVRAIFLAEGTGVDEKFFKKTYRLMAREFEIAEDELVDLMREAAALKREGFKPKALAQRLRDSRRLTSSFTGFRRTVERAQALGAKGNVEAGVLDALHRAVLLGVAPDRIVAAASEEASGGGEVGLQFGEDELWVGDTALTLD